MNHKEYPSGGASTKTSSGGSWAGGSGCCLEASGFPLASAGAAGRRAGGAALDVASSVENGESGDGEDAEVGFSSSEAALELTLACITRDTHTHTATH